MAKTNFISNQEVKKLTDAFIKYRKSKNRKATEFEVSQVVRWGERTRMANLFLDLIIEGEVAPDLASGEELLFEMIVKQKKTDE